MTKSTQSTLRDSSSRAEMEEFIHVELEFFRLEKYLKNRGNRSEGRRRHNLENKIWILKRSGAPKNRGWSGVPKIWLKKIWWTVYSAEEEQRVTHHCEQNLVTVLRLPGVAFSGQLPNGILGNLTRLRTLSLRLNALTGSLPFDLATCATCTSKVISLLVIFLSVDKMVELKS